MPDCLASGEQVVQVYRSLRSRVISLVRAQDESIGDRPVPHCPRWRVRELVAHMVGGPQDVLANRLEGVTTEAWTQAQVERAEGLSLGELADLWERTGADFDAVLEAIPAPVNSQIVLDAVTHEHDLRHALDQPGARDDPAVSVAVGFALHSVARLDPSVAERLADPDLDQFDLLRVLTGRRSRTQIAKSGFDVELAERLLRDSPLAMPEVSIEE